jgi:hypothetical protein
MSTIDPETTTQGHDKPRVLYNSSPNLDPAQTRYAHHRNLTCPPNSEASSATPASPSFFTMLQGSCAAWDSWSSITRASLELLKGIMALASNANTLAWGKHDVKLHRQGYLTPKSPFPLYTQGSPSKRLYGTSSWLPTSYFHGLTSHCRHNRDDPPSQLRH